MAEPHIDTVENLKLLLSPPQKVAVGKWAGFLFAQTLFDDKFPPKRGNPSNQEKIDKKALQKKLASKFSFNGAYFDKYLEKSEFAKDKPLVQPIFNHCRKDETSYDIIMEKIERYLNAAEDAEQAGGENVHREIPDVAVVALAVAVAVDVGGGENVPHALNANPTAADVTPAANVPHAIDVPAAVVPPPIIENRSASQTALASSPNTALKKEIETLKLNLEKTELQNQLQKMNIQQQIDMKELGKKLKEAEKKEEE